MNTPLTILLVLFFSVLLVAIELTQAAKSSLLGNIRAPTLLYLCMVSVGNIFSTYIVMAKLTIPSPSPMPEEFTFAVLGVFGFESILKILT